MKSKGRQDIERRNNELYEKKGYVLPDVAEYISGIDCVKIQVEQKPVLIVSLPPVSNYDIEETEHTGKYLCSSGTVAV